MILGVVLIVLGVVWFAKTIGLVDSTVWSFILPWLLVYLGMSYLLNSRQDNCMICHLIDKSALMKEIKVKKPVLKKSKK